MTPMMQSVEAGRAWKKASQRTGNAYAQLTAEELMHHKSEAMESTPDDEHPGRAMPQTCHQHGEEVVEIHAHLSLPVSAQRNIHIIAEPEGKRDVPATPELSNRE